MKKLLLLFPALLIMTGCSLLDLAPAEVVEEVGSQDAEVTAEVDIAPKVAEIIVEDEVMEPKTVGAFTTTGESGALVFYEGEATVSGYYQLLSPEELLGDIVCFHADEETGWAIPRDPDLYGEGNGDRRNPWFCFSNQETSREIFGLDNRVFDDGLVECISGDATVTISEYVVNKMESSVYDTAYLEEVLEVDPYLATCR